MPSFSILIPAYNVAQYIEECLNSVINQTYKNWEAIIIDDGSTDETGVILDRIAQNDDRLRVIHQINQGVSTTRNHLIHESKGEFIIFLDGDDFWCSDRMLSDIIAAIQSHNPDMIAWWLQVYDDVTKESKKRTNYIVENENVQTGSEFLESMLSGGTNCWWGWLYAFRRDFWENCGISFNPKRKVCEDAEILFRVMLQAERVWVIGQYYYSYRTSRVASVTGAPRLEGLIDILEVAENNIRYLQKECVVEECLKDSLIKNFSTMYMTVGTSIYKVKGKTKKEFLNQLRARRWMLNHLRGYGTLKYRIKVASVRFLGNRVGFYVLWVWELMVLKYMQNPFRNNN